MAEYSEGGGSGSGRVLVILATSPRGSTAKIGLAIARELDARVLSPDQVTPTLLGAYDLVGFGSGIFDQRHHQSLFDAIDRLPGLQGKAAFIFSTSGVSRKFALGHRIDDPHTPLRERLGAKGFRVIDEFNCAGFNDNSFLKLFGGMHKGKPDEKDLARAAEFAVGLRGSPLGPVEGQ